MLCIDKLYSLCPSILKLESISVVIVMLEYPESSQSDIRSSHELEVPDTTDPNDKELAVSYAPYVTIDNPRFNLKVRSVSFKRKVFA